MTSPCTTLFQYAARDPQLPGRNDPAAGDADGVRPDGQHRNHDRAGDDSGNDAYEQDPRRVTAALKSGRSTIDPSSAAIRADSPRHHEAVSTGPSSFTIDALTRRPTMSRRRTHPERHARLQRQHHAGERAGQDDDRQGSIPIASSCSTMSRVDRPGHEPVCDLTQEAQVLLHFKNRLLQSFERLSTMLNAA